METRGLAEVAGDLPSEAFAQAQESLRGATGVRCAAYNCRMKRPSGAIQFALAILLLAGASRQYAQTHKQPVVGGEKCDLRVFGEESTAKFLAFDHDLREAIEKQDAGKLALLVEFPLRVDEDGEAIFIHDARSLEGHFEQIFTPEIRKTILSATHDDISCNYAGIDYGNGEVWVNVTDKGYFLMTVNLPSTKTAPARKAQKVDLTCHTDQVRILIDSTKDGTARYRAWSIARSLYDAPDLEIERGEAAIEGTGPCAHRTWAFHTGKTAIHIEEPGCYGEVEPPRDAQAELSVKGDSQTEAKTSWCF